MKPDEMRALKELRNHPDIVVLKADKGNVTVVMNKQAYDNQILDMLNDTTTYEPLRTDPTNKMVNQFVSGLRKEKISVLDWFKLKSSDSRAPRLYGLPKIHKTNVPLRRIVSFIESPTYGLSKKLAEILSHFVGKSDRNVKNSYKFVEFLSGLTIESNEIMVSFDVVSLFTKIPVNLALQIVEDRLQACQNLEEITNWTVNNICTGLRICLEATYLRFRGKYFKQIFGTAMRSPVSVVVADLVMEDVEERAMKCFGQPPRIWERYVDDTFVVLHKSILDPFFAHINGMNLQ